jgi:hypothetical protein
MLTPGREIGNIFYIFVCQGDLEQSRWDEEVAHRHLNRDPAISSPRTTTHLLSKKLATGNGSGLDPLNVTGDC